jgi:hypothetical protein
MKYLKVINNPDLVRERENNAILNTNNSELDKYKQERDHRLKLKKLVEENEIIKSDISEIKSMLQQILGQR